MVKLEDIISSNARVAAQHQEPKVCVFAGATSGIGYGTLKNLATILYSSTFYILGRNERAFDEKLKELKELARGCTFIFIRCQFALIRDVDSACQKIATAEQKVDYICVSAGGIPFEGATYTNEGLETSFAVSYYSRLRLISNLLPQLHRAPQARVLSILNGTKEQRIDANDIGLGKGWSIPALVNHTTLYTSLAFDYLAANDESHKVVFIHATPGLVETRTPPVHLSTDQGYARWAIMSILQSLVDWMRYFAGYSLDESGARHAYLLTSDRFQPGSYRTYQYNETGEDNTVLQRYKQDGWTNKIWDHTVSAWEKASDAGSLASDPLPQ